jgi:hypothetical protein
MAVVQGVEGGGRVCHGPVQILFAVDYFSIAILKYMVIIGFNY